MARGKGLVFKMGNYREILVSLWFVFEMMGLGLADFWGNTS